MSDDIPTEPPPVEPMTDMQWARVERGLMARLDSQPMALPEEPSRRRWTWIAAPVLAAAAALIVVLALRGEESQPAPQISNVSGSAGSDVEPARVVAGDTPSSVSFGDAHITLEAKTAIVMTREGGSPSVLVERGTTEFTVAPRTQRPPFIVRAGDTVVRVVGTQFRVARSDERVVVSVAHGIVDVQFRGNTVRVTEGQTWRSETPDDVTSTTAVAPPVTPDPPVAEEPAVTPPPAPPPAKKTEKTEKVEKVEPTALPAVDLDREKYERMVALEVRTPAVALAGYLELSRGNSKWAAVALYSAGRLAADLGDRRAITFLTIYLRRFPTGANVSDARTLLQRLEGEPK
ncbi:MAG: FecR domain-containing protein [Deltaproteobacteria bacterium]|nr:FecR domain-containing protein [Deltaproteobacteria bacterium]